MPQKRPVHQQMNEGVFILVVSLQWAQAEPKGRLLYVWYAVILSYRNTGKITWNRITPNSMFLFRRHCQPKKSARHCIKPFIRGYDGKMISAPLHKIIEAWKPNSAIAMGICRKANTKIERVISAPVPAAPTGCITLRGAVIINGYRRRIPGID
jgi:hypothetical protein